MRKLLACLAALAMVSIQLGCQPSRPAVLDTGRKAIRGALHVAWRAYTLQSPDERAKSLSAMRRAVGRESIARFEQESDGAIASLDSAVSSIPPGGEADRHYLRETLAGLVVTLRDRQSAKLAALEAMQDQQRGVHADEDAFTGLLRLESTDDRVAERTILRLAAWERRFLHERYLADSYLGRRLALVDQLRASGVPDSLLLHRREIDGRLMWADSAVVAEISHMK